MTSFLDDMPPAILDALGGRETIEAAQRQGKQTKARLRELLIQCAQGIGEDVRAEVTGMQYWGYKRETDPKTGTETHTELWQFHGTLHLPDATYQVTITGPYSPLPAAAAAPPNASEQARQLADLAGACS
jgi:hypothetical protein